MEPDRATRPLSSLSLQVDRLRERAVHEAGRTIDLATIPYRMGDRVDVLEGEFASARGRVTSVKETTVNVVVNRGKVRPPADVMTVLLGDPPALQC